MASRGAIILAVVAVLAAGTARAQPPAQAAPADPIDALLRSGPPSAKDAPARGAAIDEPDTAAAGSRVEPDAAVSADPNARRPPAPTLSRPVNVDETGKSPDGPPTAADLAYDERIRAGLAAAQGFLGPLDGGWTLTGGGRELYVLQLADRNGEVQGAWRDPRRTGQSDASGLIDEIARDGGDVRFRFGAASGVLHPAGDGRWTGDLTEGGRTQPVKLARRNP